MLAPTWHTTLKGFFDDRIKQRLYATSTLIATDMFRITITGRFRDG
jgi:hypothetical protein